MKPFAISLVVLGSIFVTCLFDNAGGSALAQELQQPTVFRHALNMPRGTIEYSSDLLVISDGSNVFSMPATAIVRKGSNGGFTVMYGRQILQLSKNAKLRIVHGGEKVYTAPGAPVPPGLTNPVLRTLR